MSEFSERIAKTTVKSGTIELFFLGQAGFVIKTPSGRVIYLDPYLSDSCNRLFGFKRIFPSLLKAEEVKLDLLICTHEHADHLDVDSIPVIAEKNPKAVLTGPSPCMTTFKEMKLSNPTLLLKKNEPVQTPADVKIIPMPCDHGELAPEALGLILEIEGIRLYFAGDTAYREDIFRLAAQKNIDIMFPPINGKFGNLNSLEAAQAIQIVKPKLAIPCHFWLFIQHNGDPGSFVTACEQLKLESKVYVMAVGEQITYPAV